MKQSFDLDIRRQPEQGRSKDTVHIILEAAKMVFGELGIDVVSMTRIAQQAGISKPALYRYFPNKQAIVRALAEQDFVDYEQLIQNLAVSQYSSLQELVIDGIRQYSQLYTSAPYRIKLKAAIQADPVLAQLNLVDSRKNAQRMTELILDFLPQQNKQMLYTRILLLTELLDGLMRLISLVDEAEADSLINEFVKRFTADLI